MIFHLGNLLKIYHKLVSGFFGISFPFFGIFVHFILEYPIYISQSNHLYNFSFTAFSWSCKMPLEMKMVESVADLTAMNGAGNRMS